MLSTLRGKWAARRAEAQRKFQEDPIGGLRDSFRWMALGACLAVLVILLGGFVVWHLDNKQDEEAAAEQQREEAQREEDRITRSIEACFNYNEDQTNDRATAILAIPEMAVSFFNTSREEADALLETPGGEVFVNFVRERNPYRQCSRECVIAHTTPGQTKCDPALNEQGEPP